MAWCRPGDKPLSEPMVVSLLTHICFTRPQWLKKNSGHFDIYISGVKSCKSCHVSHCGYVRAVGPWSTCSSDNCWLHDKTLSLTLVCSLPFTSTIRDQILAVAERVTIVRRQTHQSKEINGMTTSLEYSWLNDYEENFLSRRWPWVTGTYTTLIWFRYKVCSVSPFLVVISLYVFVHHWISCHLQNFAPNALLIFVWYHDFMWRNSWIFWFVIV